MNYNYLKIHQIYTSYNLVLKFLDKLGNIVKFI